jgi:hypothetical protein
MNSKYFSGMVSDRPMLKADIVRELIYLQADELLPMKTAVVMKPIGALDFKYDIPKITRISSTKVSEGARSDRKKMEFWQKAFSLEKYQTTVTITDESKVRSMGNTQLSMTMDAVARGMAYDIDTEIATALAAATPTTTAVSAATTWDAVAASPARDIALALGKIFDNTNIMERDLSDVQIYVPSVVWPHLKFPKDVGLLYTTVKGWIEKEQAVTLYPTRKITGGALVVLPGQQTAHHLTYNGTDIPTAESQREIGVGEEFVITRYYKTVVIPDTVGGTTTCRLGWINGVS